MIVLIADQIDSRTRPDLAGAAQHRLQQAHGPRLVLPVDRSAGDELQILAPDGATALAVLRDLLAEGEQAWRVGLGTGAVRDPLPGSAREATGPAFIAAREAIGIAKKRASGVALRVGSSAADRDGRHDAPSAGASGETTGGPLTGEDADALLDLLATTLRRRSPQGWELDSLVAELGTQAAAAERLAISPQAASARAAAADLRVVTAALPAYARILDDLGRSGTDTRELG